MASPEQPSGLNAGYVGLLLEQYLEKTGDHTPIYYLIEKFLHKPEAEHDAALEAMLPLLQQMAPLMKKAGLL